MKLPLKFTQHIFYTKESSTFTLLFTLLLFRKKTGTFMCKSSTDLNFTSHFITDPVKLGYEWGI